VDFITGKHIPRRTFLRGVGATVALPFLDAMVPSRLTRASAAATERTRLVCIEEVHGLAGCNLWGASKHLFAPETTGRDFTLVADNPLSTLNGYREHMTIVSNNDVRMAEALRVHLIERRPDLHVGALGLLRVRLREEHRARSEVVAADFRQRERLGVAQVGVADDGDVVLERLERRQAGLRQVEVAADLLRRPQVLGDPELRAAGASVHHLHRHQPDFRR